MSHWFDTVVTILTYDGIKYSAKLVFETFAKNQISLTLSNIFKNVNLPFNIQIKLFQDSEIDRYFGFLTLHFSSGSELDQVKQCLYEVYCVCRKEGLTENGKNPIFLPSTFSDKSLASAKIFFERSEEKWLDGFLIQPYGKLFSPVFHKCFIDEDLGNFRNLVLSFKPICRSRITGKQSYLFMICSGSIIGAVYDMEVLTDCVFIAS